MRVLLLLGVLTITSHRTDAALKVNIAKNIKSFIAAFAYDSADLATKIGFHGLNGVETQRRIEILRGRFKERLQQTYGGLEVVGGGVTADYDPKGGYNGDVDGEMYSSLEEDIPDPSACNQDDDVVANISISDAGTTYEEITNLNVKKNILVVNETAFLTYEVNFFYVEDEMPMQPCYFIDACGLTVLYTFNNIRNIFGKHPLDTGVKIPRDSSVYTNETDDQSSIEIYDQNSNETYQNTSNESTEDDTNQVDPQNDTNITSDYFNVTDAPVTSDPSESSTPSTSDISSQNPNQESTTGTDDTRPHGTTESTSGFSNEHSETEEVRFVRNRRCSGPARGRGGNRKIGSHKFGKAPFCLDVKVRGRTCYLENSHVRVVDLKRGTRTRGGSTVRFTCSKGYSDATNGAYSPVLDAMYYGTIATEVFKDWYKITPLRRKPALYVHYGKGKETAYFDGRDLVFGDGSRFFYPLVGLDVVAHELSHGFTNRYSKLMYDGEAGAIDESFSDITGEVAKFYARGSNDWEVGADIIKHKMALRYFSDPTKDGNSVKHTRHFKGQVHSGSGIFNYAFYHIVKVKRMNIKKAYHCFLNANRLHWSRKTTFEEGACGVVKACKALRFNYGLVKNSFKKVGIRFRRCRV